MGNTAEDYGRWIVKNKHLKGTPEFNKVAEAYQKSKTTKRNPYAGSGVFDEQVLGEKPAVISGVENTVNALKRGGQRVLSTGDLIKAGSQMSDYNRSQGSKQDILKGMFDKQFGSTYGMQWNPSWQTPQDVFNGIQDRASDIGVSSLVNSQLINFTERYNNMTAEWEKNQADGGAGKLEDAITSFGNYKGHLDAASGYDSSVSGKGFQKVLAENKKEDETEETGLKGFWNGTKTFWRSIGEDPTGAAAFIAETAIESAPVMVASIGTTLLTKSPVLGSLVMATGAVSQEAGSTAMAYLEEQGVPMETKEDALAVLKNHDLLAEANRKGFGKGLVVAAFELLGQGAVARTYYKANKAAALDPSLLSKIVSKTKTGTKSSIIQAATGGGGEAASQIAIGEEVDASDVWIEALAEIATGPVEAVVAGASLTKDAISTPYTAGETDGSLTSEFKSEEELTTNEAKAYTSLALELNKQATGGGLSKVPFDLMDIDAQSKKGAKVVSDNTHKQLVKFMNRYYGELVAKGGPLNPKGKTEAEVDLITLALTAKDQARNKVKGQVSKESYDALEALVGNTKEGQNLIRTLMQLDALTQLDGKGLQGGLSEFTDKFSILGRVGGKDSGFAGASARLKPLITGMAAASTTGASLIPQAILPGLGRYIDKKRGTYSVLDKYIKDNIKGDPLDAATGPSVVAAKQLEEQTKLRNKRLGNLNKRLEKAKVNTAQRETAKSSFENAEPATPGSPQYVLEQALGVRESDLGATPYQPVKEITPQVLVDLLEIVKAENETSLNSDTSKEVFKKAVEEYQKSIIEGGTIENDMLSPVIRKVVSMAEKQGVIKRRTTPNSPGPSNTQMETPAISRGIADNQAVLANLTEKAKADPSVDPFRVPLEEAQNNLGLNLGTDPVSAATDIVNKAAADGVPNKAIKSYLRPYVDRIVRQAIQSRTNQFQGEQVDTTAQAVEPTKVRESKVPPIPRDGPALNQMPTALDILPDVNEVEAMRDPKWKPEVKRSKEAAAQFLQDRWEKATGRTTPFEYTEENVDVIADIMVAEAMKNLESDGNAIGWYDVKIKAAKKIVSIIEPRIMQSPESEAMFDFALAVTSNGQAVTGNFKLALEVFRTGMDTGLLPENFNKGGDRAEAMRSAFKFYNAFGRSGSNISIQQFLDQDFTVKELKDYINRFNSNNGTEIKVGGQERVDTQVKGSYILGPKIGQGFYQNIRGNYNPLTMDLWWMRTWNRMVGRPFESKKTDAVMAKTRDKIATEIKKGGKVENQLVKETLKELGETKKGLYKDPKRMDVFVLALDKNWQKYFRNYQKANNKKNPPKPQLFKSTGTHVLNSSPQMQAQPSGPDRPYMRKVVEKAREKLREQGIDIETADFQALMWYPEKLLYKKLGVDPGNGADTDYQDAATILAQNEGITDGQIEEALSDADRGGAVDSRPDTRQQDGRLYPGASPTGPIAPEGPGNLTRQSRGPALTSPEGNQPRTNPPSVRRLKPYVEPAKKAFEIGKPGSDLEDGIGTLGEALELARALNLTVTFLNEMAKGQTGEYAGFQDVKDADGVFRSTTKANVRVLRKGSDHPMFTGQQITSVKEFTSLMHEIAHGLAIERTDRVPSTQYRQAKNEFVLAEQALETVKVGSFEDFILDAMENYESQGEVLKEIVNLQENIDVEIARKPHHGTTGVRPLRQVSEYIKSNPALRSKIDDNKLQEINNNFRRTYLSTVAEMAVDPLWVYLINPKLLKKVAPNTAKAIRKTFNNYGGPNQPVTFYSYPLATIMAIVVGVVANLEEEEEKRNSQPPPPPGALSPDMNMGALSA